MSTITLVDTGHVNLDHTDSEYPTKTLATSTQKQDGEFKANDGTAVEINITEMKYRRGANLDSNPNPGYFQNTEVNFASVENPTFIINGVVNLKTFTEMDKLLYLDDMAITKGYKELYYNGSRTTYRELTNTLGSTDTQNPSYYHFHVRVESINMTLIPTSSLIKFTIQCKVTG